MMRLINIIAIISILSITACDTIIADLAGLTPSEDKNESKGDSSAFNVAETDGSTEVTEGLTTDSYDLSLNSPPNDVVIITVTSEDGLLISGGSCTVPSTSCDFCIHTG
jgi:hypothetical protein